MTNESIPRPSSDASWAEEHDDPIGRATLGRMANVDRYNRWIFEEIAPFAGRRMLEVGCGIGNMTDFFLDLEQVVAIDRHSGSVHNVRVKYATRTNVQIYQGDITTRGTVQELMPHRFDTVMCLNVLEHIEQDQTALRHMAELLMPGGHLLLFVPAGQYMYGSLDRALGHYCRYEKRILEDKVRSAGFRIVRSGYLNLAGIPGWWLNSRILRRTILSTGQLRLFNALAPLFIGFERGLRHMWDLPVGQSLVCIGQRVT